MDRQTISHLAHAHHPIASPISGTNLNRLLRRARLGPDARILDLGCGQAVWSVRLLELYRDATADGVDLSDAGFEAAWELAVGAEVASRLSLHLGSAAEFTAAEPYDLVLCVGATHAFGGLGATMEAINGLLAPGGLALVGEGFWDRPPSEELEAEVGTYPDLSGTVAEAEAAGYRTVYAHVSERDEWYDYEFSWTGSLMDWALRNPGADGDAAMAAALEHRKMWLDGYRDRLGFVTLVLRRTP
ncbi:SAM-dependent methyltransferase [Nonomuraea rhizosphaerae]|uniref:SAM-dependent methyltransferase n=1 Tax=Nonomuraea rhizosphaerae TaxID=2665663 RepID=UPI001C5CFE8A|nr:class I SAM-dependent methyltransferase [Nonomuraea rhizosphaerae]